MDDILYLVVVVGCAALVLSLADLIMDFAYKNIARVRKYIDNLSGFEDDEDN